MCQGEELGCHMDGNYDNTRLLISFEDIIDQLSFALIRSLSTFVNNLIKIFIVIKFLSNPLLDHNSSNTIIFIQAFFTHYILTIFSFLEYLHVAKVIFIFASQVIFSKCLINVLPLKV